MSQQNKRPRREEGDNNTSTSILDYMEDATIDDGNGDEPLVKELKRKLAVPEEANRVLIEENMTLKLNETEKEKAQMANDEKENNPGENALDDSKGSEASNRSLTSVGTVRSGGTVGSGGTDASSNRSDVVEQRINGPITFEMFLQKLFEKRVGELSRESFQPQKMRVLYTTFTITGDIHTPEVEFVPPITNLTRKLSVLAAVEEMVGKKRFCHLKRPLLFEFTAEFGEEFWVHDVYYNEDAASTSFSSASNTENGEIPNQNAQGDDKENI